MIAALVKRSIVALFIVAGIMLVASQSLYTVDQRKYAVVFALGSVMLYTARVFTDP